MPSFRKSTNAVRQMAAFDSTRTQATAATVNAHTGFSGGINPAYTKFRRKIN
jgi:hypothetical protein